MLCNTFFILYVCVTKIGCLDDIEAKAIIGFKSHWPGGKKPKFTAEWYSQHLENEDFKYLAIDALDNPVYDLTKHYKQCFDFLDICKQENRSVLVHCMQGVNRSAAIVVGYLCDRCNLPLESVLKEVAMRRADILSNNGFLCQLIDKYDKILVDRLENDTGTTTGVSSGNNSKAVMQDNVPIF